MAEGQWQDDPPLYLVQPDGQVLQVVGLRDWFAGQALRGVLGTVAMSMTFRPPSTTWMQECADDAYAFADCLLLARVKVKS